MLIPNLNNRYERRISTIKKRFSEFYVHILNNFNFCNSFQEKLYCFANNILEKTQKPKCIICGKETKFRNFNVGYLTHCSNLCYHKNIELLEIQSEIMHDKWKNNYNNIIEKRNKTCLTKYGVNNGGGSKKSLEKYKKTCLTKYGNAFFTKSQEYIDKIDNIQQKIYQTKKQNNSFNSSKIEKQFEAYLKENNINYKTQYKSELYPFNCDFYFPDKDLYLEIQGMWTHGGHPFDSTSKEDQLKLEYWKQKGTEFYDNAIQTWTIRDVNKRNVAKQNNLNYLEIFDDKLDKIINIFLLNKKIKI